MAKICRPPVLGIIHQVREVLFYSCQVKFFKLLSVVKFFTERIGERRILVKDLQVHLVWPPVPVGPAFASYLHVIPASYRALVIVSHRITFLPLSDLSPMG